VSANTARNKSITLASWPRAILHIDGDAFFASCEQSIHPELKGKPVITGKERNIVASMSYEAKALGIKRGTAIWQVRKICPEAIILPSDYETYSLISKRMFSIMRQFSPMVEESSIDEGYADLEGLRRVYRTNYVEIAKRIRQEIEKRLDISASAGLSLTKTLAKLAAKHKKPRGFTAVPGYRIHEFLKHIPASEVCGIGPNTSALLAKRGVHTCMDYVNKSEPWIHSLLGKIGTELWLELRGERVYGLNCEDKTSYITVSKAKTFTPPSTDPNYVKAQLFRNTESALIKIRRHGLRAKKIFVFLCRQDFRNSGLEGSLNRPSNCPLEFSPLLDQLFQNLFRSETPYRQTGVVLTGLSPAGDLQFELFEDPLKMVRMQCLAKTIDEINNCYGKHSVFGGQALYLNAIRGSASTKVAEESSSFEKGVHDGRHALPQRKTELMRGETFRQRLGLPVIKISV